MLSIDKKVRAAIFEMQEYQIIPNKLKQDQINLIPEFSYMWQNHKITRKNVLKVVFYDYKTINIVLLYNMIV